MNVRRKTPAMAASFLAACLGTSALTPAAALAAPPAEQTIQEFSIAPQPLQSALLEFSRQSQSPVVASTSLISGMIAPAVQGRMAESQALDALLAGSGLYAVRGGDGGWAISRKVTADPQSGSAAGGGAEVEALIVTAQKREEDIQDVPIAISAFTQEDLTRSQVAGGPDLMTQVPNMTFTKTNFNSYSIQIRGIGTQAISATTDPAVAVAFNNTPFVRNHFFEQEFYDLQRIEVLRGPQGTLYGRNATAGVVNIISAKPKFFYEAKLSADVANYNSKRLEGMINILLGEAAAVRLAGAWTKRDGFVTNTLAGEQTDGRNLWSWRASLAIEPTDWFRADLIYERFEEDDDRLRSGKQVCMKDPGPSILGSTPVPDNTYPLLVNKTYFSQGCAPASMYSPDSFQTPNGFALPYYGPAGSMGAPVYQEIDPYVSATQSRDLREIETHIAPEYTAKADLVQLQLSFDIGERLTLSSETGFARDFIFSWQDFNRFNTTPGVFVPTVKQGATIVDTDGTFCDPQIGCTNRLAAADIATAKSQQFAQEFRLSSDMDGPMNFNLGVNFLRYDTEDKYYVFINSLTAFEAIGAGSFVEAPWVPGVSDNAECLRSSYVWSNPDSAYDLFCAYIDPNDIHNLNDQGRNYFLSKNPYSLLSYAAFGEIYYHLTPDLKLTGGFRWTVDKKTAPQIPSWLLAAGTYGTATRKVIEQEWREPTGRVAIDWKPALSFADETLVYASYVRGYKAGGANPPPPVVVLGPVGITADKEDALLGESVNHPEAFEAEYVDAYEIGTKNTLLDGRLTLNLGAFYYDYTGYQISRIVNRSAINSNFDATIWGMEMEADWRPLDNLSLGLKVGYEDTRVADGEQAIDLMNRTAGKEDWVLMKPFPPQASNCVIPVWFAEYILGSYNTGICSGYIANVDPLTNMPYEPNPDEWREANGTINPITPDTTVWGLNLYGYQGYDPASANKGEGFFTDLSGNELPNAPHYTATVTADWTLPLPNQWLMTLHTDFYYQSEAWTRIFNMEGYDKLRAYTNVNFAAIFTNEDAGWNVMAYVKNVLDRDSITGAFLNSDDTGLTTNVFLTEPRLYGLRVTKAWNGDAPLGGWLAGEPGGHSPFRVELSGQYGEFGQDREILAPPTAALFPADHPYPLWVQEDLDWGSAGGGALTYQPRPDGWFAKGAVRYGRASGEGGAHSDRQLTGLVTITTYFGPTPLQSLERDLADFGKYNYTEARASNEESHTIVDFMIGRDWNLGSVKSTTSFGLRYAHLESVSSVIMHGVPDQYIAPELAIEIPGFIITPSPTWHTFHANLAGSRQFEGAGVAAQWDLAAPLFGGVDDVGQIALEAGLGGSVLWGRQKMESSGEVNGTYQSGIGGLAPADLTPPYTMPLDYGRSSSATVPSLNANLGLSYELGRTKIGAGYRWERYFDAMDGGIAERQEYDRDIEGMYFKLSVGFGG